MRIDFNLSQRELGKFVESCEAVVRNVGASTKSATVEAIIDIMSDALNEVPIDTGTLASSIFGGVYQRMDLKGYRYGGVLGFGEPRGLAVNLGASNIEWISEPNNAINPKSGLPASAYAARVHEDLDMPHPNGGKAKFLEDPVRNYAASKFARTAMVYWKRAIQWSNFAGSRLTRKNGRLIQTMGSKYKVFRYKFEQQSTGVQRGGERTWKGGTV